MGHGPRPPCSAPISSLSSSSIRYPAFACCATNGRAAPRRSRAKQNSRALQAKQILRPYFSSDEARGAASPLSGGGGGVGFATGGGGGAAAGGGGGGGFAN